MHAYSYVFMDIAGSTIFCTRRFQGQQGDTGERSFHGFFSIPTSKRAQRLFLGKFSEAGKWREREQGKEQEREKLENEIERLGRLEREVVVVLSRRISP